MFLEKFGKLVGHKIFLAASKFEGEEKERFSHQQLPSCEQYLTKKERLPENFPKTRDEVFNAVAPVKKAVNEYLQQNFLNADGIIDSEKIAQTFKHEDDIQRVLPEVPQVKEALEIAHKEMRELLPMPEAKSASPSASAASPRAVTLATATQIRDRN